MSRATPQMRDFARRLTACEISERKSSVTKAAAPFHACARLHPHLATLMGHTGFRTLLERALKLAHGEVPWLRAVQVNADGTLDGLGERPSQVDPDEFSEGGIVLLAQVLGLLVAFIGENLTLRLVREVWPKVSPNDLDFGNGGKNEKTK
jgi:hypothetical protein